MRLIKHIIEFILVQGLFLFFRNISIDYASSIGGFIGRNLGPYLPVNKVAYKNIKNVFPHLQQSQVKQILQEMWDNLGRVFAEFPHIYQLSSEEFSKRIEIHGIENLDFIKKHQNAGVFFSAHMANWEISPRIPIEHQMKLSLIYRAANNRLIDKIICRKRNRHGIRLITKGTKMARQIINDMKKGYALAMLVDQKMNDGIKVPLLGRDAMTPTAIAKLTLKFKCPVIPAQVIRKKGAYFTVKIYPPLQIENNSNTEKEIYDIMLCVNNIISNWIQEYPGQWFWVHKRWGKL